MDRAARPICEPLQPLTFATHQGVPHHMQYDIIGDIHGQADKLEALFARLGYWEKHGSWVPPQGHQAVFVGDLIDRGPQQVKVVDTVRRMVDAGHAHCVLGNHEFNAIAFATPLERGSSEFLRPRDEKNLRQHKEFLAQVGDDSALHQELVDWFRTLPPALDLGPIRVVHAWWHDEHVRLVQQRLAGTAIDDVFLRAACKKGSAEYRAMEGLTKGLEVALPEGVSFEDRDGAQRHEVRVRWWDHGVRTYREAAQLREHLRASIPDDALPGDLDLRPNEGTPVFVGHYKMQGEARPASARVACVDYSAEDEGPLVCYRWQGESDLQADHFVEVSGNR